MNEKTTKFNALVLNIYNKNNDDAIIKVLSKERIAFVNVKSFFKHNNKNKANIFIGSISEFETIDKYKKGNYLFLKKAILIHFYNYDSEMNKNINQYLFFILQQIESANNDIYECYEQFLKKDESYNKYFFLTYLLNLVLETKGKKLVLNKCVVCHQNRNLFCVDVFNGGMLCYSHKTKNAISTLAIVKKFYNLSCEFQNYCNGNNEKINSIIFKMLLNIIY